MEYSLTSVTGNLAVGRAIAAHSGKNLRMWPAAYPMAVSFKHSINHNL
jgi:hypothetical protein